jgi:hypothetical protein
VDIEPLIEAIERRASYAPAWTREEAWDNEPKMVRVNGQWVRNPKAVRSSNHIN